MAQAKYPNADKLLKKDLAVAEQNVANYQATIDDLQIKLTAAKKLAFDLQTEIAAIDQ